MKKLLHAIIISFVALAGFLVNSCSDNVNPFAYEEKYFLNCIIKTDTTFQVATISRTYLGDEEDYIQGAKITLTCTGQRGSVTYTFRDTTSATTNNEAGSLPRHFYYIKNFNPWKGNQMYSNMPVYYTYSMTIVAELPNGKKIGSSSGSIPVDSINFEAYKRNVFLFSPYTTWKFGIQAKNISPSIQGNLCMPELIINYKKFENGTWNNKTSLVPLYYTSSANKEVPIYPVIDKNGLQENVIYDTTVISQAFKKIFAENDKKENYKITKVQFCLNVLGSSFSYYVATQQTFEQEFSYRIVSPVITNITGGYGIFGAMCTIRRDIPTSYWVQFVK